MKEVFAAYNIGFAFNNENDRKKVFKKLAITTKSITIKTFINT